ncbi:hypothetical protein EVAR_42666_1 [Eumeta japonica]|uniref:Uncharacterized protein n=1 Tax=Eumeta variegata TaxID=151549 RepID=A0A4C1YR52_EUMVA|nr:hypothetical protein EVAR_42666_1 [Eumeta japonica]
MAKPARTRSLTTIFNDMGSPRHVSDQRKNYSSKPSNKAPKQRSARHEPVCMPISLSLALSLSLLGGLTVLEWKGRVPFTFLCLSLSLLGGLTMPEWKGRVPLTRSHCERIT